MDAYLLLLIVGLFAGFIGVVYFVWVFYLHKTNVPQTHARNVRQARRTHVPQPHSWSIQHARRNIPETHTTNVTKFSLTELKSATNMFHHSKVIGQGAFGLVYRGQLPDGSDIAVKCAVNHLADKDVSYQSELSSLSLLTNHRNIVKLLGCCDENSQRILVYNFYERGSLGACLRRRMGEHNRLDTWQVRYYVALGVAKGICYLHEWAWYPIIHGDIKPANILLDANWNAFISDFGLARMFDASRSEPTRPQGTPGYMDPEYHRTSLLTPKIDVYAFGVVLLEIVTGRETLFQDLAGDWVTLVDYVTAAARSDNLIDVIDETMTVQTPEVREAVLNMLDTALFCVVGNGDERPHMSQVVALLQRFSLDL